MPPVSAHSTPSPASRRRALPTLTRLFTPVRRQQALSAPARVPPAPRFPAHPGPLRRTGLKRSREPPLDGAAEGEAEGEAEGKVEPERQADVEADVDIERHMERTCNTDEEEAEEEPDYDPSEDDVHAQSAMHAAALARGCDSLPSYLPDAWSLCIDDAAHCRAPLPPTLEATPSRTRHGLRLPPATAPTWPPAPPSPSSSPTSPAAPGTPPPALGDTGHDDIAAELRRLHETHAASHAQLTAALAESTRATARLEARVDALQAQHVLRREGVAARARSPTTVLVCMLLDALSALLLAAIALLVARPYALLRRLWRPAPPQVERRAARRASRKSWRLSAGDYLDDPFFSSAAKRISFSGADFED